MAPKFKLETVLKHRRHLEESAQKDFFEARCQWEQARSALDIMTRNQHQYRHELKDKMRSAAAAADVVLYQRYIGRLKMEIESQTMLVEDLDRQKEKKRLRLLVALKNRRMLEKLKKRFQETEARKDFQAEQKLLNEVAVTRYKTRPRSDRSSGEH
jgi:flagellar FliJ protein